MSKIIGLKLEISGELSQAIANEIESMTRGLEKKQSLLAEKYIDLR